MKMGQTRICPRWESPSPDEGRLEEVEEGQRRIAAAGSAVRNIRGVVRKGRQHKVEGGRKLHWHMGRFGPTLASICWGCARISLRGVLAFSASQAGSCDYWLMAIICRAIVFLTRAGGEVWLGERNLRTST